MRCKVCNSPMKPLLTSMYCPQEAKHGYGGTRFSLRQASEAVGKLWPNARIASYSVGALPPQRPDIQPWIPADRDAMQHAWWRLQFGGMAVLRARDWVDWVDAEIGRFLQKDVLTDLAAKVGKVSAIRTFEIAPHWVRDDGAVMVRQDEMHDAFEVRMRALWIPVP